MSNEKDRPKPIPTRYDDQTSEILERIHNTTGVPKSEIIRSAVRFALDSAESSRSLDFLLGDSDMITDIFGPEDSATIAGDDK